MPTFKEAILDRCQSSMEGIGFLNQLKSALLAREGQGLELALAAPQIEALLAERTALVRRLTSDAEATAVSVVTALAKEAGRGSEARPRGLSSSEEGLSEEGQPLGEAIRQALQSEAFSSLIKDVSDQNLSTVQGKRNALAAGFNGECVFAVRVLCSFAKMGDPLRNQDTSRTLAKLSDLRPDRFDYFNHMLRLDVTRNIVPERMMRYSFATAQSPALLEHFLQFEFDKMDWFAAPHGLNGYLQAKHSRVQPAVTDPRDYFARIEQLRELGEFGQRLFTALGCTVHDPEAGLDFQELCTFYADHLHCSWQCANQEDQLQWIEEAAASFKATLSLLGATLRQKVYSADPSAVVLTRGLVSLASEEIQSCKRKQETLEEFANWRVHYQSLCPPKGTPLASEVLPFLSRRRLPASEKSGSSKEKGQAAREDKSQRRPAELAPKQEEDTRSSEPGSRSKMHTWGNGRNLLFISGQVWNVKGIADRFKLDAKAYCWPYLLANCRPAHRASRCEKWGQPGHTSNDDTAHRLPQGIKFADIKEFMRLATSQEKDKVLGPKSETPRGRRGAGKGSAKKPKIQGGDSVTSLVGAFTADESDPEREVKGGSRSGEETKSAAGPSNGQPATS